jgi:hypothetical protein
MTFEMVRSTWRIVEEISRLAFSHIGDVLTIEERKPVVKDHATLDPDTLSTVASVRESVNEKGHRSLEVRQHDRLAALTLLARVLGMLINRQEISAPVKVDHSDHSARIRNRLDEIARTDRAADDRCNAAETLTGCAYRSPHPSGKRDE